MTKKSRFYLGAVFLLFVCGAYVWAGLDAGASASELIPPWPVSVSVVVMLITLSVGFWYLPTRRWNRAAVLIALSSPICLVATNFSPRSFPPAYTAAVVAIVSACFFWPTQTKARVPPKNQPNQEDGL